MDRLCCGHWDVSKGLRALHLVFLFALVFSKLQKTSLSMMENLQRVWQEHSGCYLHLRC